MLKRMITFAAVAGLVFALAVSVTPALGANNATWTGLGATDNWSDMLNWKLADGVTWASGAGGDPAEGRE